VWEERGKEGKGGRGRKGGKERKGIRKGEEGMRR